MNYSAITWRKAAGCTYPSMPQLQRRFSQTTIVVMAWAGNYIPRKHWVRLLIHTVSPVKHDIKGDSALMSLRDEERNGQVSLSEWNRQHTSDVHLNHVRDMVNTSTDIPLTTQKNLNHNNSHIRCSSRSWPISQDESVNGVTNVMILVHNAIHSRQLHYNSP